MSNLLKFSVLAIACLLPISAWAQSTPADAAKAGEASKTAEPAMKVEPATKGTNGDAAPAIVGEAAGSLMITQPDAFVWVPAAGLPPGAKVAVLYGDPSKAGPFAVRFDFPAGYEVPTHSHPTDEFITVVSGKMRMAFGEKADATGAQSLVPGSFMSLPAGAWHHLWVDADSVVELHSTGPFAIKLMTK
jgi:quercetin dioxygenase-like cupin family protein